MLRVFLDAESTNEQMTCEVDLKNVERSSEPRGWTTTTSAST